MPTLNGNTLTARQWADFYNDHPEQLDAYFKSVKSELDKRDAEIARLKAILETCVCRVVAEHIDSSRRNNGR